jgi:hypothetical protein
LSHLLPDRRALKLDRDELRLLGIIAAKLDRLFRSALDAL